MGVGGWGASCWGEAARQVAGQSVAVYVDTLCSHSKAPEDKRMDVFSVHYTYIHICTLHTSENNCCTVVVSWSEMMDRSLEWTAA